MESDKFESYKKRLQGICDENNLIFRFRCDSYPVSLTIRPVSGVPEQMSMIEKDDGNSVISPDAMIAFAYKDGELNYKTSKTFTISDTLFSKIKNLYKNMHAMWLQFFHRDIIGKIGDGALTAENLPRIDEGEYTPGTGGAITEQQLNGEVPMDGMEPLEVDDDGLDDEPSLPDPGEDGEDAPEDDADDEYPYEEGEPDANET